MTEALQAYLNTNFEKVEGWCIPHLFQTISLCSNVQQDLGLDAPVAEIGVYHGKFFIGLVLGSNSASGHHAIDVFDMQEFNLDGAGKGNLDRFVANLAMTGIAAENCNVIRADSMKIGLADMAAIHDATGGFSFFSIDGCHMVEHTINDIRIAMELTDPRGIIFVDDYYNASWPGVQEGVAKLYFHESPRFVPLLYTCNKLFLCHISYHGRYFDFLKNNIEQKYPGTRVKPVKRFGYDTLTIGPDMSKPARLHN